MFFSAEIFLHYMLPIVCALFLVLVAWKGWDRVMLIMHIVFLTIPMLIMSNIYTKLTLTKAKKEVLDRNGELEQVSDRLWVVRGNAPINFPVTMSIVKQLNSNKLAVFTPIAPQAATFAAVRKLGEVAALVLVHMGHDSHALAWQAEFPKAKIIASKSIADKMAHILSKRTEKKVVVTAAEEELKEWSITCHDPPFKNKIGEQIQQFQLNLKSPTAQCLLIHDYQVNIPNYADPVFLNFPYTIAGWAGSQRTAPFLQFNFIHGHGKDLRTWLTHHIANISDVECVVFAHGGAQKSKYPGELSRNIAAAASKIGNT